jgi:hypothetical protein
VPTFETRRKGDGKMKIRMARVLFFISIVMASCDFGRSKPVKATDIIQFLSETKSLKSACPNDRTLSKPERLLSYQDLISDTAMSRKRLLEKKFIELSECDGDSIFTEIYDNGMVSEEGRTRIHFVGNFNTGVKKIKPGSSREEIIKHLGPPNWSSDAVLIYTCPDTVEREHGDETATYECGWFYFKQGKLIGLTFEIKSDC